MIFLQTAPVWQYILTIALSAAFLILFLEKTKVLQMIQIRGNKFFSEMAKCHFCLSFWVGLIFSIIFAIVTGEPSKVLYPILTAPLTRLLL